MLIPNPNPLSHKVILLHGKLSSTVYLLLNFNWLFINWEPLTFNLYPAGSLIPIPTLPVLVIVIDTTVPPWLKNIWLPVEVAIYSIFPRYPEYVLPYIAILVLVPPGSSIVPIILLSVALFAILNLHPLPTCNIFAGLFVPIPTLPVLVMRIRSSAIFALVESAVLQHKNTIEPISNIFVLQCPIAHLVIVPLFSVPNPINVAVELPALVKAPADIFKGKHVVPVEPDVPWFTINLWLTFGVAPIPTELDAIVIVVSPDGGT